MATTFYFDFGFDWAVETPSLEGWADLQCYATEGENENSKLVSPFSLPKHGYVAFRLWDITTPRPQHPVKRELVTGLIYFRRLEEKQESPLGPENVALASCNVLAVQGNTTAAYPVANARHYWPIGKESGYDLAGNGRFLLTAAVSILQTLESGPGEGTTAMKLFRSDPEMKVGGGT